MNTFKQSEETWVHQEKCVKTETNEDRTRLGWLIPCCCCCSDNYGVR